MEGVGFLQPNIVEPSIFQGVSNLPLQINQETTINNMARKKTVSKAKKKLKDTAMERFVHSRTPHPKKKKK